MKAFSGWPDESWDEIVELYQGVETVAFRTDDGGLSVETEDGREQVPIGYWVVKNGMGVIAWWLQTSSTVICSDAGRVGRQPALTVSCWGTMLARSRCVLRTGGPKLKAVSV